MTERRALTSARGLAAWWVVLFHLRHSMPWLPAPVMAVLAKGYLAVDFFFLLSGFVIWLSWHERLRSERVARFLQKRIARIWPLHLVMLGFATALALLLAAAGKPDPAFPFAQLPLHITLIQNWGFTDALAWNDPAWSISCELAAYLLFPLLILATDWRRWPTRALVTLAALILVTLHLVMRGEPTLGSDIPHVGLARCLAEFTTGTIVAALWLRSPHRPSTRAEPVESPTSSGPMAVIAASGVGVVLAVAYFCDAPESLVVPAILACLLYVLAHDSRWLAGRVLHWLGEISYATYLSHFLLWKAVKLALVNDAGAAPASVVALYLAMVLAASAALYRLVERPAQAWVNGLRLSLSRRSGRLLG